VNTTVGAAACEAEKCPDRNFGASTHDERVGPTASGTSAVGLNSFVTPTVVVGCGRRPRSLLRTGVHTRRSVGSPTPNVVPSGSVTRAGTHHPPASPTQA
jgi:hypothetical protein